MMSTFVISSHAAIENCDFNVPKDGDIDGNDLAQFAGYYAEVSIRLMWLILRAFSEIATP